MSRGVRAAAALLLILALCGCGAEPLITGAPAEPEEIALPAATAATYIPAEGGEIFISVPAEPETLNPLLISNLELLNFFALIYEPVIRLSISGKPEAALAETYTVSEDGLTWTFKLREGIVWHDGTPLTSADVIYTLDLIRGYTAEQCSYASLNSVLSTYAAVDGLTFTVTTQEKGNALLYNMNFPVLCASRYSSPEQIDSATPMGTGPYKLSSYAANTELTLAVNESWWRELPYIQAVRAVPVDASGDRLSYYQSGILDLATTPLLTVSQYRQYETTTVADYMTQYYDCLMTNNLGKLSDLRLRKAISYAINKSDLIYSALMTHGVAADLPLPPDSWLYDTKYSIYEYNLARANELLDELGIDDWDGDGVRERADYRQLDYTLSLLALETDKTLYLSDVAKYIAGELAEVGITVEIKYLAWEEYQAALAARDFDMALVSYYLDRDPDPTYVVGTGAAGNLSGYSSTAMDAELRVCAAAVEEAEIRSAYASLAELFVAELPHIPLYFRTNSLVYDNSIKGVGSLRADSVFMGISEWYLHVRQG